jgi:hypothetical protein
MRGGGDDAESWDWVTGVRRHGNRPKPSRVLPSSCASKWAGRLHCTENSVGWHPGRNMSKHALPKEPLLSPGTMAIVPPPLSCGAGTNHDCPLVGI